MNQRFRKPFLVILVTVISVAFLAVVRSFLLTILVAAILSVLVHPSYERLVRLFHGRRRLASGATIVVMLVIVLGPVLGLLGVIVNQAVGVTQNLRPTVDRLMNEPLYVDELLRGIPGYDQVAPYRQQIVRGAANVVNAIGGFFVSSLSDTTRGTVSFVFHFFLALYTMFFLLTDGPGMRDAILSHLPLSERESALMRQRFMSITRATVRGTLVVGLVQGSLAGLAFWVVGIPQTLFWTTVMVVLSVLPVIGSAIIWVPACIILLASGKVAAGLGLALFCALIVGSVDNVLRPRLVGQDTQMHELVILFSTLGGIATFGIVGFVIGPILAGLFQTSWNIFAVAYGATDEGEGGDSSSKS